VEEEIRRLGNVLNEDTWSKEEEEEEEEDR
jgi:hypothetical protein